MKSINLFLLITILTLGNQVKASQQQPPTNYYINPQNGSDGNNGKDKTHSWKTFIPVNRIELNPGDKVNIIAPGDFHTSLVLNAQGSRQAPVTVSFAPGAYNFYPDAALKKTLQISNTNDVPQGLKAIALYINHSKFVHIKASGAKLVMRGKMIMTCVDYSENVSLTGMSYDYFRPTVSELTVTGTGSNFADLKIHPDTRYSIRDSVLTFEGEGWQHKPFWLWQILDPQTGDLQRTDIAVDSIRYTETGDHLLRAWFKKNPGFKTGLIYQNRDVTRDCSGIFIQRSKNISLQNINIYFMHGMGVVSQFCENIRIIHVRVKPQDGSGLTCAAWADILHFSGCKGLLDIGNSYLSGANDDAINVHGTYLRVVNANSRQQITVRFMHNQTYGFAAFTAGDSIAFIHPKNLQEYAANKVLSIRKVNEKDYLLTLKNPAPRHIDSTDVIENTTWTPRVWIHEDTVARIPTRGVLVTSRRKAVIEHNVFVHTHMSAISVADDAASWYESGRVKDMLISNNQFNLCGEPAIIICPENKTATGPVHQNIRIINNQFILQASGALSAKSTANLWFINNRILAPNVNHIKDMLELKDCTDVNINGNKIQN